MSVNEMQTLTPETDSNVELGWPASAISFFTC
jgi:hypothetical protein